jgi:hypothetical protein
MSATDLKPCPFCGAEAGWVTEERAIECGHCAATGPWRDLREADWNTRPIEDALRARAEAAERDADAWRGFAGSAAIAVHGASTGGVIANHLAVDDLPDLLGAVREALATRDRRDHDAGVLRRALADSFVRGEAAEVEAVALRARAEAAEALVAALRAEVEAGVVLAVVRAEIAEVTLTTAQAEGASLRDQLDDALRRAREAEAALATARAEGAAAERAAVLAELRDDLLGCEVLPERTEDYVRELIEEIEAGRHVRPVEGA